MQNNHLSFNNIAEVIVKFPRFYINLEAAENAFRSSFLLDRVDLLSVNLMSIFTVKFDIFI